MNKYYVPQLEDFYQGYIFEEEGYDEQEDRDTGIWTVNKFSTYGGLYHDQVCKLQNENIRTKYLDKQDIESLGWKFEPRMSDQLRFSKNDFILFLDDEQLTILKIAIPYGNSTIFDGECKSINELKTIMKFLNIKNEDKS